MEVEVDAKYIRGMLKEPDLMPNATINRWIQGILLFDFELRHVPATRHKGPDALSRKELGEGENIEEFDDSWLDDIALYIGESSPTHSATKYVAKRPLQVVPSYLIRHPNMDREMERIRDFLRTNIVPPELSKPARVRLCNRSKKFFLKNGELFRKNGLNLPLKAVFSLSTRLEILQEAHEKLGHRGEYATMQTIRRRFYWPTMWQDAQRHVKSCHQCQIRSTKKAETPLNISIPIIIFFKWHIDIFYMIKANGFQYCVAAREDLSRASEGRPLRNMKAKTLAAFFWEEIICRYGAIGMVVTDNGPEVQEAFAELVRRYGIPHIKISPYNSKANGVVERGHFIIRESIMKACQDTPKQWPNHVRHAFFADKVTINRSTGTSPFYLLHGVHPVLPFDLLEATAMVEGFYSGMTRTELLTLRMRQLEKRPEDMERASQLLTASRLRSKAQFERRFKRRLYTENHKPGALVLVRNTMIEKSLNRKCKPRYLGPFEVVRRTQGGSYILQELDGAIWSQKVAAFRLLPYILRDEEKLAQLRHNKPDIPQDIEIHEDQEGHDLQEDDDSDIDSDEE